MAESARKSPLPVDVVAGQDYWWCACGKSLNQPFCDGSHKGSGMSPLKYTATETTQLWFCVCKKTGNPPLCDGTHSKL